MRLINKGMKILISLIIIYSISTMNLVYCDNGSGENKDGKSVSLDLEESTPADGEKNVKIDTEIVLLFNKNVVNMTVKDNNLHCIKLLDEKETEVFAELVFADDQMNPEKKREIRIKPVNNLEKNKTYKVKILPELMAKNGTSLGKTIQFSFNTVAAQEDMSKAATETPAVKVTPSKNNDTAKSEVKSTENIETAPAQSQKSQPQTKATESVVNKADESKLEDTNFKEIQPKEETVNSSDSSNSNYIVIFSIGIIILLSVWVINKMRKKR